jgi:hypothetical protein
MRRQLNRIALGCFLSLTRHERRDHEQGKRLAMNDTGSARSFCNVAVLKEHMYYEGQAQFSQPRFSQHDREGNSATSGRADAGHVQIGPCLARITHMKKIADAMDARTAFPNHHRVSRDIAPRAGRRLPPHRNRSELPLEQSCRVGQAVQNRVERTAH